MKKLLLFVVLAGIAFGAYAKQSLKQGDFICEDKWYSPVKMSVQQHPEKPHKIVLNVFGRNRILHAVETTTGALRYEGAVSKLTYIQTPSHSVLLDSRGMKALLTDCRP